MNRQGLPGGASGKEPTCQCRRLKRLKRCGFNPWVKKIPWRRKWQCPPVFLPGEFHGQRSLVGCSPWGCKESDMTEHASIHIYSLEMEGFLIETKEFSDLKNKQTKKPSAPTEPKLFPALIRGARKTQKEPATSSKAQWTSPKSRWHPLCRLHPVPFSGLQGTLRNFAKMVEAPPDSGSVLF